MQKTCICQKWLVHHVSRHFFPRKKPNLGGGHQAKGEGYRMKKIVDENKKKKILKSANVVTAEMVAIN